ncbi:MAG: ACP S-malonyltransferase [Betaproteobacteria bacterium]|nr:ACP S-malonyltransferase [Betaproteobacteria bacterium]
MKIAFVFPGQGSQSVGMMKSFAQLPCVRDTFSEASDAIGQDMWKLVEEGPADELNLTINTQPAMLTAGVALHRAWNAEKGTRPAISAGHSLGEYSALVAGGAIDFADAVKLVRFRAQAMQEAVPAGVGAMAAILGLEDDVVRAACQEAARANEVVEAANFNSPAQVVIAGNKAAVERAMEVAKGKGAKRAVMLPMSVPSHCSLMRSAAERMHQRLVAIKIGISNVPVLHNADVKSAGSADAVRDALVRQLYQPVRWVDTVRAIVSAGATHIVECGPGKVLAGLNKRIAPETPDFSFDGMPAFREALAALK